MHMTVNIDRYIEDMEQWKKTREENDKLQQELQRKDNNRNELKRYIKASDDCWDLQAVLDKMKELEENK